MEMRRVLAGIALAIGLAAACGALVLKSPWASRRVEERAIALIESRFDGTVEVEVESLSLFPRVAVTGRNLRLTRTVGDTSTPFIQVHRFEISGSPLSLLRRRVSHVEVDGVEIRITRGRREASSAIRRRMQDVWIDEVHLTNGLLLIVPDNPNKIPLEFELHEVTLSDFRFDQASAYSARLTNPKPSMVIQSEGRIGPWNTLSPRETPLSGVYTFNNAELETIKGLGGRLASSGSFDGVLERIAVQGTTSSTDFQLQLAQQPVPLETRFSATVDGTTGDTQLDEVDATLGSSRILARGKVGSTPGAKGRTVTLTVTARDARLEDFLRLSVKADEPPMRGAMDLDTGFELPPGDADVPQRLDLTGRFTIRRGRFSSDTVQNKVDELSRRGQGSPESTTIANVMSAFSSTFTLRQGVLQLPNLRFGVNGAQVELGGDYRLHTEALNFSGALTLDASLSQTVTGFKSVLLKAIDPLFRRGSAGTRLPIRISGTIDQPNFGLDVKRVLKRN